LVFSSWANAAGQARDRIQRRSRPHLTPSYREIGALRTSTMNRGWKAS
jgi:hypothetical protein